MFIDGKVHNMPKNLEIVYRRSTQIACLSI